jgi:F-type H+-transporting ATPase subunit delta
MTNRASAKRYARALFDVGLKDRADLEQLGREIEAFARLFDTHAALAKVLLNPAVPTPRKRAAVEALAGRASLSPHVARLFVLLAERDRLVLLPDLVAAYRDLLLDHQKVVRARVTTAAPLSPARARAIEKSLAQATGRSVTLAAETDPSLIGGIVARVGSTVYDASVVAQLARLKQRLIEGR